MVGQGVIDHQLDWVVPRLDQRRQVKPPGRCQTNARGLAVDPHLNGRDHVAQVQGDLRGRLLGRKRNRFPVGRATGIAGETVNQRPIAGRQAARATIETDRFGNGRAAIITAFLLDAQEHGHGRSRRFGENDMPILHGRFPAIDPSLGPAVDGQVQAAQSRRGGEAIPTHWVRGLRTGIKRQHPGFVEPTHGEPERLLPLGGRGGGFQHEIAPARCVIPQQDAVHSGLEMPIVPPAVDPGAGRPEPADAGLNTLLAVRLHRGPQVVTGAAGFLLVGGRGAGLPRLSQRDKLILHLFFKAVVALVAGVVFNPPPPRKLVGLPALVGSGHGEQRRLIEVVGNRPEFPELGTK